MVLFVVDCTDPHLIAKHKRVKRVFTTEDYELVREIVSQAGQMLVTPNTLTEASNLLAQHGDPERSSIFDTFKSLIEGSSEIVEKSKAASSNPHFARLGLTDSALLEVVSADMPVLTVDFDLYNEACKRDPNSAINYFHIRDNI